MAVIANRFVRVSETRQPPPFGAHPSAGGMLWLRRKRLSGS
jgi:hypothetical protein